MSALPRRDTAPELRLRKELFARGLRYRVHSTIPALGRRRRVDVVFPRARIAVFIDGCFWHGCPTHGGRLHHNREWWKDKIDSNKARDEETDDLLVRAGWRIVRAWEHDDVQAVADRVERLVRGTAERQ